VLDELQVLKLVTGRLDAAGIAYMLTGSIALGHYAQPRMTRDIDLVVAVQPADADRFCTILGAEFECDPASVRGAIERQSMFNLIHTEAVVKVDFVVRKDSPYRLEEFSRRRSAVVDGQPMWIVAPEDLILSKLVWASDSHSEVQLRDVRRVIMDQPGLDWTYLDHWALLLGVNDLLREVRS
jgi:hypothetical protein